MSQDDKLDTVTLAPLNKGLGWMVFYQKNYRPSGNEVTVFINSDAERAHGMATRFIEREYPGHKLVVAGLNS